MVYILLSFVVIDLALAATLGNFNESISPMYYRYNGSSYQAL